MLSMLLCVSYHSYIYITSTSCFSKRRSLTKVVFHVRFSRQDPFFACNFSSEQNTAMRTNQSLATNKKCNNQPDMTWYMPWSDTSFATKARKVSIKTWNMCWWDIFLIDYNTRRSNQQNMRHVFVRHFPHDMNAITPDETLIRLKKCRGEIFNFAMKARNLLTKHETCVGETFSSTTLNVKIREATGKQYETKEATHQTCDTGRWDILLYDLVIITRDKTTFHT